MFESNTKLKEMISALKAENETLTQECAKFESLAKANEVNIAELQSEYAALETQYESLRAELADAVQSAASAKAECVNFEERVNAGIASALAALGGEPVPAAPPKKPDVAEHIKSLSGAEKLRAIFKASLGE
jgi:chromosome segregation ATPase